MLQWVMAVTVSPYSVSKCTQGLKYPLTNIFSMSPKIDNFTSNSRKPLITTILKTDSKKKPCKLPPNLNTYSI